ncbi:glycosyl transferase [Rhodococcoides trifolii]|uniref:Glycosyl transferase n=1 Tax=Rhodococcoides trifolii TaxID=908250 RepID=A0A917CTJ5_9NOCA|nr:glycosyltransferase family 2 protein [Rhodococcus trifolii]GGF97282.1 glycosyl transferase [Rhodococcus trifolii]
MTPPTLSVVVPAYNEEETVAACLESLFAQIDEIDEIIVVDNNSTDDTERIVKEYAEKIDCLRLVHEPVQGILAARSAGFGAATGDVIGRVDADSLVRPGWARAIKRFLESDDSGAFGGVTGISIPYDSPFGGFKEHFVRGLMSLKMVGNDMPIDNLAGANMAIRKSTWTKVKGSVSTRSDVHEDVDLALTINDHGLKIAWLGDMWVDTSPRRRLTPPTEFTKYVRAGVETFALHGKATRQVRYLVAPVTWGMHALTWLPYRAYDPELGRVSLRTLVRTKTGEVRSSPVRSV